MSDILDTAIVVISDESSALVKNSTLGLDSGLSSANDISVDGVAHSSAVSGGLHLSAFSSIDGLAVHVGKCFNICCNEKTVFSFQFLDETGSYDEFDDSIIPIWLFAEADADADLDDSVSFSIRANYNCVIDKDIPHHNTFNHLPGSEFEPDDLRPRSNLDYIKVTKFFFCYCLI